MPGPAAAHARLISATPAPDSMGGPTRIVTLVFSERSVPALLHLPQEALPNFSEESGSAFIDAADAPAADISSKTDTGRCGLMSDQHAPSLRLSEKQPEEVFSGL